MIDALTALNDAERAAIFVTLRDSHAREQSRLELEQRELSAARSAEHAAHRRAAERAKLAGEVEKARQAVAEVERSIAEVEANPRDPRRYLDLRAELADRQRALEFARRRLEEAEAKAAA